MQRVFVNRIATAVPTFEVHGKFVDYAPSLLADERSRRLFKRMADRAQIERRWSFVEPHPDPGMLDRVGFFPRGAFPDTQARMRFYERHAPSLALAAIEELRLGEEARRVTHLIVTSCTGFYAPGLDLQIMAALRLDPGVERTMVGFMGCQAALPALKLATHIVRSQPRARVLTVNLELCTIHLQETSELEQVLSFLIFADGCAASLVSGDPEGLELFGFRSAVLPESAELITWHIGNRGYLMHLDGKVPTTIERGLPAAADRLLAGQDPAELALWAVHPGGRTILDAVEAALALDAARLAASREVLRAHGNMSSATVMFVLKALLEGDAPDGQGCALAFGPGLTAETMHFGKGTAGG